MPITCISTSRNGAAIFGSASDTLPLNEKGRPEGQPFAFRGAGERYQGSERSVCSEPIAAAAALQLSNDVGSRDSAHHASYTQDTKVCVPRLAADPNSVRMDRYRFEAMSLVERQCSSVLDVDEQFELFDAARTRLAHHSIHQNPSCSAPLMGRSDIEGPDFSTVACLLKRLPSQAAITDEGRCVEYTPGGPVIEDGPSFLRVHGLSFIGGDEEAEREVTYPLLA
jgi:hypothetical protein